MLPIFIFLRLFISHLLLLCSKCFAIIEFLQVISSPTPDEFLIATDSLSRLQALNIFKSNTCSLIIETNSLRFLLFNFGFKIQVVWIPCHLGNSDNEIADSLTKSTSTFRCSPILLITWCDFCPTLKISVNVLWGSIVGQICLFIMSLCMTMLDLLFHRNPVFIN